VSNDQVLDGGAAAKARQALATPWSRNARRRFEAHVEHVRPHLVHVHNLFPLLSGSVAWATTRRRLPLVWTALNHRVVCVDGTHFRDGTPCHDCRPGWRVPGVRHGCYRDSRTASGLVTVATSAFRSVARRHATAIAVSATVRDWLVGTAGFDPGRVRVKPNGIAAPAGQGPRAAARGAARSRTLLFAGKLAPYKGVDLLLDAWRRARPALPDDVGLQVLGDGPMGPAVAAAAQADPRITWTGHVPASEVGRHMAAARAVVVPSVWDEPFGRVAAEALAHGRPVVTTGLGGLGEIVDDGSGWVTGTDPDELAKVLAFAASSDAAVAERAAAAVQRHDQLFSPAATTRALVDIYTEAIAGLQS
jgi:glycosyltransferase involved in cell wall biosynthesis